MLTSFYLKLRRFVSFFCIDNFLELLVEFLHLGVRFLGLPGLRFLGVVFMATLYTNYDNPSAFIEIAYKFLMNLLLYFMHKKWPYPGENYAKTFFQIFFQETYS